MSEVACENTCTQDRQRTPSLNFCCRTIYECARKGLQFWQWCLHENPRQMMKTFYIASTSIQPLAYEKKKKKKDSVKRRFMSYLKKKKKTKKKTKQILFLEFEFSGKSIIGFSFRRKLEFPEIFALPAINRCIVIVVIDTDNKIGNTSLNIGQSCLRLLNTEVLGWRPV